MHSNPAIQGCPLTSCCSATLISRWCITTESLSEGCRILHFGRTTSLVCGCSSHRLRPWCRVIWRPRFRPARFLLAMLAPLSRSLSRLGRLRRTRRRMSPTRVCDESVGVESPIMTIQDIPNFVGALCLFG